MGRAGRLEISVVNAGCRQHLAEIFRARPFHRPDADGAENDNREYQANGPASTRRRVESSNWVRKFWRHLRNIRGTTVLFLIVLAP